MSKLIYVCFKDPARCTPEMATKLETICHRITPDNITPRPPKVVMSGNVIYGIQNPASSIKEQDGSVLLGMAYGDDENWWKPGATIPDGSFSIFRSDEQQTELLTDVVGSRSIWYYHDEEILIASSSQRAIVMVLGNFEFNKEVIPWMLSTGSLGPYLSWDKRIKLLPSDSVLRLKTLGWEINLTSNEVKFEAADLSDQEHEKNLMTALTTTFKSLKLDFSKWVLPLSGGYDSRGILSMFHHVGTNIKNLRAITWGLKSAINQSGNDAFIAKKLAKHYKIEHKYFHTDLSEEPLEKLLNRFLICGEGRIDHVGGYLDGFEIWKTLYESNVEGIIRGDVSFSSKAAESAVEVRKTQGLPLCSDFANLQNYEKMGFRTQQLPANFFQKESETLEMWRDRLYQQFRMPVILAALNDLKLSFVEVVNPLLSKGVVLETRKVTDSLRSGKLLFKRLVKKISPNVDYATSGATADAAFILKSPAAVSLLKKELNSATAKSIYSEKFLEYLLTNLETSKNKVNRIQLFKSLLKRLLPKIIINKASKISSGNSVGVNTLAFRAYMIVEMKLKLTEDVEVKQFSFK